MFKSYSFIIILSVILAMPIFANGQQDAVDGGGFVAAMATDTGGLGDQSFNDGVYAGLEFAEEQNNIEIRLVESRQQTDYIPNLTGLAEDNSNIVFGVGFLMAEAIQEAALSYPDTYFAGIDIFVNPEDAPPNLVGILFQEHESGYLAGVLAGLMTKQYASSSPKLNDDNVVGTVLGLLIPPVERYEVGYKAGVHKYNPECQVISVITGSFSDTTLGKEAALAMIDQGADIILPIAGLTGVGSINAARERGVLAIGADVDQNYIAPNTIITSAIKKLTQATYLAIQSAMDGSFAGGRNLTFGIEQDATGLAPFHQFDNVVPQEVKDILNREIEAMRAGEVTIPTTRSEAEALGIRS